MATIMDPPLRGSGRITGVFFNAAKDIAAVVSEYPLLVNPPARAACGGGALRYRVALHRRGEAIPYAAFDDLRFPVNDVAFHPTQTTIAIGAGAYDGGYMFEGDLVAWNWRSGKRKRLFNSVPEVVRCRYNAAGDRVEAWVRPWDEEWGVRPGDGPDDAFNRLYVVHARCADASGSAAPPVDLEFGPDDIAPEHGPAADPPCPEAAMAQWLGMNGLNRRGAIKAIAWLDEDRIAIAHDGCLLEICRAAGEPLAAYTGAGHGSEILRSAEGVHVHVVEPSDRPGMAGRRDSRLYALTEGGLRKIREYDGEYTFSASRQGVLLGRRDRSLCGGQPVLDCLLDLRTGAEQRVALGHYDCFNHYIGINGAPWPFLLQGTPASSHERKHLCLIEADGQLRRLWPLLKPDGTPASHAMENCGCYVEDAEGAGIVISGKHYSPTVGKRHAGFIYRKRLDKGRELWRQPAPATASAVVSMPGPGLIAAAFLDGGLRLIDARSGRIRLDAKVRMEGLPNVIHAMDAHGEKLALGMVDGRIAVVAASELLAQDTTAGWMEMA